MHILATNDDGIHFPGITELARVLRQKHKVSVVGPAQERSATSMALTIYDDVYVKKLKEDTWIVNGYPTDCVNIALYGGILSSPPDLVISGINKGVNMGEDVLYSGTVGAASHAAVHGIPAWAVSSGYLDETGDFTRVAEFILQLLEDKFHEKYPAPVLNINMPAFEKPPYTIKWTKLGLRFYRDSYKRTPAHDNGEWFNLGGSILDHKPLEGSDFEAFAEGCVSITPLALNRTDYEALGKFIRRFNQR
ncbi:MAG: 5'/3'-nucleotidase SurE [Candidatus Hydrogenedentota bacterium]|nr:MAG: 5'/3'-nucleotidase SurE [Candidatus Hydrogenedentota bacterium]